MLTEYFLMVILFYGTPEQSNIVLARTPSKGICTAHAKKYNALGSPDIVFGCLTSTTRQSI